MSLAFDIGQGAGVSGATGVRPFLPTLLTGALASRNDGIDFDRTSYAFLEHAWFLFLILVLAAVSYGLSRRPPTPNRVPQEWIARGTALVGVALGALLFAGSLAAGGETSWWGLPAGAACAALGYVTVAAVFARARRRVEAGAASLLDLYADGIALVLAGVSLFVEPVGFAALALFLVLLARSRGEAAQKYGGLRILR